MSENNEDWRDKLVGLMIENQQLKQTIEEKDDEIRELHERIDDLRYLLDSVKTSIIVWNSHDYISQISRALGEEE